jgi:hypothetical protein
MAVNWRAKMSSFTVSPAEGIGKLIVGVAKNVQSLSSNFEIVNRVGGSCERPAVKVN